MTTEEVFAEMEELVKETEHNFCVYKHTDPQGKVYIGYCCGDMRKRWNYGNGYKSNKVFHEAIHRIGAKNFTHETIASGLTYQEAMEEERRLIQEYDSTNPEKGYNRVLSQEEEDPRHYCVYTLQCPNGKMYAGYTGRAPEKRWENGKRYRKNKPLWNDIMAYGWDRFIKCINAEHLDAYSARNFEYYLIRRYELTDPEKGYNQNYGGFSESSRKLTDEERQSISRAFPGKKAVRCVETGEVFDSAYAAAKAMQLNRQHINDVCKGKGKTAGGYHWEFWEGL